jgi:hypothetical protein
LNKKIYGTTLLSTFVFASACANAEYLEQGLHHNLGLEGYHHTYRETVDGNFFMQLKGPMFGIYYNLAFQPKTTCFRFAIESRAAWGSVNYNSRSTGRHKNGFQPAFEGRLLGSYITIFSLWVMENYIGFGARYLVNHPSNRLTTTGHSDYLRKSQYNYIPIGLRVIKELNNEMQFISYLEYDWFLSGLQKSYVGTTHKHRQSRGYGARIGMDFHIPSCTYCLDYTIGVFARYWNIKDSKKISDGIWEYWEPKNNTKELGVRVGLAF